MFLDDTVYVMLVPDYVKRTVYTLLQISVAPVGQQEQINTILVFNSCVGVALCLGCPQSLV